MNNKLIFLAISLLILMSCKLNDKKISSFDSTPNFENKVNKDSCCMNFTLNNLSIDWNSEDLNDRKKYWDSFLKCGCILDYKLKEVAEVIGYPDYNNKYYYMENAFAKDSIYHGCFLRLVILNDSVFYFIGDCH